MVFGIVTTEVSPVHGERLVIVSPASWNPQGCNRRRPPDWPWLAATCLSQGKLTGWQLQFPLVRAIAAEIDRQGPDPLTWAPFKTDGLSQYLPQAAKIYFGPVAFRRQVHALMLDGGSLTDAAPQVGLEAETIIVYGLIFYDVEAARFWRDVLNGTGIWASQGRY